MDPAGTATPPRPTTPSVALPRLLRAVALVLVVPALAGLGGCGSDDDGVTATTSDPTGDAASGFAGVVRDPQPQVGDLTFPEVVDPGTGETSDFSFVAPDPDGLLLVYFGYTSCPDVCPTTMADVKTALADLGDDADRVSLAMVTVDPERDTGEVLDGYVRFFVPENSHILRSEDFDQLHAVEDGFGARSDLVPKADGEGYDVEHTGTLYAVDGDGTIVVEWPFGSVKGPQMASDMRQLLDGTT